MLIFPGINMLQGVERRVFYDNIIGGILDYLDDLGVLEEMTAFEKQEYLKEPTKFRALSFSCRSGLNSFLLNSSKPQVKGDNINSDFIFDSLQGIDATSMLEQDEDGIDLFEMILQMGIEQSVVEDNGVSIDSRNGGELLSLFTNEIGILNYFGKHQWFLGDRLCLIRRRKK